jgi:hypothetical protein
MSKQVTFSGKREGQAVTVRALIAVLEKALRWLRGRDENEPVDWEVVRIALGDPVQLTFRSESANGSISQRMGRLHSIQNKRLPKIMPRLTDDDIDGTVELASVLDEGFKSFQISSIDEPTVNLTPSLVERVEEIAKKTARFYYEYTTVRGTLYELTAVIDGPHRFRIERLDGDKIPCNFTPDKFAEVKEAIKSRVEIHGRAKCSGSGEIKSIEVRDFRVLRDNPVKFSEMPGIDITGGLDTVEHIERIRGGN